MGKTNILQLFALYIKDALWDFFLCFNQNLFGLLCLQEKSTFLLVLDAKTFTELGRAEVSVSIPAGTHGVFNEMG